MTDHQTTSCWMNSAKQFPHTPLNHDAYADVCVVGAGIAGLTTAYLLACDGLSVVVLDSGVIGGGQTLRTTAHLSNAIDARYYEIERLHGEGGALLAAQSHTRAIKKIEEIALTENIDCDLEWLDGYLFLAPNQDKELLEMELEASHRAGLRDVELLDHSPLGLNSGPPCLCFPRQGQFHPMKYLYGLAEAIEKKGGRIYSEAQVKEVEGGHPAHVRIAAGPAITCSFVVVATNTPVINLVALHTKQAAYRSYVIAARIPVGSVPRALYWDNADPYHYVRLQKIDGPAEHEKELLIVGGEDHKTGQKADPVECFRRLEMWARPLFPQMKELEYCWSGQILETIDGLAFIGRNPGDHPNVFIATGDSGMGMTHGTIAGVVLTDLIMGRDNPWASLYDPARKTLLAAGEFTRENLNSAWQYTDWLTPGEVDSEEQIPADRGAILRTGLRKLAVYRDPDGELHTFSATCPHLGGVVHWNDAEKTWDCPCHGSRFDCLGTVLNGPAIGDLTPVENPEHAVMK